MMGYNAEFRLCWLRYSRLVVTRRDVNGSVVAAIAPGSCAQAAHFAVVMPVVFDPTD